MEQDAQTEKEAGIEQSTGTSSDADTTASIGQAVEVSATAIKIPAMAWTCPTCSAPSMTPDPKIVMGMSEGREIFTKCHCGETLKVGVSKIVRLGVNEKVRKIYAGR